MNFFQETISWVFPVVIFLITVGVLYVGKRIFFAQLSKWSQHTEVRWDDIFVYSLRLPANFIILAAALWATYHFIDIRPELKSFIPELGKLIVILSVLLFVDRFAVGLLRMYAKKQAILESSQKVLIVMVHIASVVFAMLFVLNALGISITPFLASLGIGSMAVAFALQDTLSNAFAGMHMMIDKPIARGQLVEFSDGKIGVIDSIGWRSTRIKFRGHVMIIPNSKLSGSMITNYDLPSSESFVSVECMVNYENNMDQVEQILLEEAKKLVSEHPSGSRHIEPFVRFQEFGEHGIKIITVVGIKQFSEHVVVKSELIKMIHKRFQKEDIKMAYLINSFHA